MATLSGEATLTTTTSFGTIDDVDAAVKRYEESFKFLVDGPVSIEKNVCIFK